MAIHSRPAPIDPYNPMPVSKVHPGENEVIRHPSPFIPIRLPIFAIIIWSNDSIVRILNVIGGRPIIRHKEAARSRAFSDAPENAEGGDSVHTVELTAFQKSLSNKSKPMRPAGGRINIGARKYD
jgi:etoposide-induced 2.4 mRNA